MRQRYAPAGFLFAQDVKLGSRPGEHHRRLRNTEIDQPGRKGRAIETLLSWSGQIRTCS